jgi:hypothetical protein
VLRPSSIVGKAAFVEAGVLSLSFFTGNGWEES